MGSLIKEWVTSVLTESIKKKIVVYAGRFQPFHKGHAKVYELLVKKFGKENVFIGTSDKTDKLKSPFNFKEKQDIMTTLFGIPKSQIVKIKKPYAPSEILNKFPKDTTAFITVAGAKDKGRLLSGSQFLNESKSITIYHGDNHGTKHLIPKLMNNGNNQEGIGIYFSNNIETAFAYGKKVVSLEIDEKKFIPARDMVKKHLNRNKLANLLKGLYESNPEAFFYYVSDYIEVHDIDDVEQFHIEEMSKRAGNEQVRNFQIDMAEKFGVDVFVQLWNKEFKNIHGTYNRNSNTEIWYGVINDSLKLKEVGVTESKDDDKSKYFKPYNDADIDQSYRDAGYVYIADSKLNISATDIRKNLSTGSEKDQMDYFKKLYPKFDKRIFNMITDKLKTLHTEIIDEFIVRENLAEIIKEATLNATQKGTSIDDGPGFTYGNFKTFKSESEDMATALGWEVVNYLMDEDSMESFDTDYPNGPGRYQVSFFPSGIKGLDAQALRYGMDFKGNEAYKKWAKHITKVATMVGYKLVDFMDADESIEDSQFAQVHKSASGTELTESTTINEGGVAGHMAHPFDIELNLTFSDLKNIIKKALNGNLELTHEKADGMALAISWRDDKGLIAARNKGHLKNSGENALTIKGVASKFKGRGVLTDAYNFAMSDLNNAIVGLSKSQRDEIFMQGKSFMNLEVLYPSSINVIPYNSSLLIFHNTTEYNDDGVSIGENQGAARILAGMIKKINKDVQNNFSISGPPVVNLPKNTTLSNMQGKFYSMLSKLQNEFKLKDSDGVADYHQSWWSEYIEKNTPEPLPKDVKIGLVKRWAFNDKGFRINNKFIESDKVLDWANTIDKMDKVKLSNDNIKKFEDIFLGVGSEVLSFMSSVLTVNPDKAVRAMKARLDKTIKDVQNSNDPKKIEKLKLELERLTSIGGKDRIVPNEGIVFTYNKDGNTYTMKLTGAFSSLNQILGLMYY